MVAPLLENINIEGKNITLDALHTQTRIAKTIVEDKKAHYFLTVKGNQPTLQEDISFYFENNRNKVKTIDFDPGSHGRIETRAIQTTTELNDYLNFPHVKQAFRIERTRLNKKTGKETTEIVYGITSRPKEDMGAKKILETIRAHWGIENSCHYILDWVYHEDQCRIRTGHGPENITGLRRFAIGLIKSKAVYSVTQKMRELSFRNRAVLDYLKMTKNSKSFAAS